MFNFRKVKIPSGEQVEVTVYHSWTVRWWSMARTADGNLGRSSPESEIFKDQAEAERFADELRKAMHLLRDEAHNYNSGMKVTVTANQ